MRLQNTSMRPRSTPTARHTGGLGARGILSLLLLLRSSRVSQAFRSLPDALLFGIKVSSGAAPSCRTAPIQHSILDRCSAPFTIPWLI